MNDNSILSVEDVHVYYGSSHVLQGVSIALQDGVAGIIGRNGMGKTTLVRAIMGLVPVKSGTIKFNNEVITNLKPYQIAGRGIGYVPQGRALFPSLSVEENLKLAARTRTGKDWTIERVYDLFPILQQKAKQGASLLSGGQQQMLAIGRALVTNPTLLILDEPSEGLAPVILDEIIETFHKLAQSGIGLLLVEQNLHTIISLEKDNLYVMVAGKIAQKVNSELLLHDKKAREQLLGVAQQDTPISS